MKEDDFGYVMMKVIVNEMGRQSMRKYIDGLTLSDPDVQEELLETLFQYDIDDEELFANENKQAFIDASRDLDYERRTHI